MNEQAELGGGGDDGGTTGESEIERQRGGQRNEALEPQVDGDLLAEANRVR